MYCADDGWDQGVNAQIYFFVGLLFLFGGGCKCVSVRLCTCMYVSVGMPRVYKCPQWADGIRSPTDGIRGSCESLHVGAGDKNQTRVLGSSRSEPSLQPTEVTPLQGPVMLPGR